MPPALISPSSLPEAVTMPRAIPEQPSVPNSEPDLAFLARLARRNTVIVVATVDAGSDDGACSHLVGRWQCPDDTETACESVIAPEIIAAGLAAGFIGPAKDPRSLALTSKGRSHLRRLRALKLAATVAATAGRLVSDGAAAEPVLNPAESPIAWLRRRVDRQGQPMISAAQFEAGERLRADLWFAGLTPRVTQSWSGLAQSPRGSRASPGGSASLTDARVAAGQRVNRALEAVGPEFGNLLVDVCGHLRGLEDIEAAEAWPQRSAKVMLQTALTALARHYGLLPPVNAGDAVRRRLRHWGSPDYRPGLDRWR